MRAFAEFVLESEVQAKVSTTSTFYPLDSSFAAEAKAALRPLDVARDPFEHATGKDADEALAITRAERPTV